MGSSPRPPVAKNANHGLATLSPKNNLVHALGLRFLQTLPTAIAHRLALKFINRGGRWWLPRLPDNLAEFPMRMKIAGVGELMHPIGLAAGFDKNAYCPRALCNLGFSFLEIGTVTPEPQAVEPQARLFRLPTQFGLIDNTGHGNAGMETVASRLHAVVWDDDHVPLAVNIGRNEHTIAEGAVYDFLRGIEKFRDLAHFTVLNVSTSHGENLRSLANRDFMQTVAKETEAQVLERVWVKLDPDMPRRVFQDLVKEIAELGFGGLVLTNTHRVVSPQRGGRSGHSLAPLAITCLEWAYEVTRGELPLIASGGILSGSDIVQRIRRGASAVEIYTAIVYYGGMAVAKLLTEMVAELRLLGFTSVSEAKGTYWQD